jgi:class 3 adenylate cyclase
VSGSSTSNRRCSTFGEGPDLVLIAGFTTEIRAGVHTAEIERRGRDVAGIGVHIASRIADVADPGSVWVSRTVTDLVAGCGLAFEPRGEHQLRGVPDAWALYEVTI